MLTWVDAESTFGTFHIKDGKISKGKSIGVFKENTSFHQVIKKANATLSLMKTLTKNGTPKYLICRVPTS